jgi:hypothetical protein
MMTPSLMPRMAGMIAVMGIALWIVTVLGIVGIRDYRAH